jgi:drug/metabolite transporter (DMT)-like permease
MAVPLAWNIVMGSFAPFLLSLAALRHLPATAAGIVASSEVVFAFAVAWIWLGEVLDPIQIAGAAIVLAGIIIAQTARAGKVIDADLALSTGPITTVPSTVQIRDT